MLWVACYMVPMFLISIFKYLREWWTGQKEEERKPEVAASSGCPVGAGNAAPEGVTNPHLKASAKVAGESSDAGNLSTDGVSDDDKKKAWWPV